jgi:hypothetical protein
VVVSGGGSLGNTHVGFAFKALEGDSEQFSFAGCESGDWLV